jgi:hypothetical protein
MRGVAIGDHRMCNNVRGICGMVSHTCRACLGSCESRVSVSVIQLEDFDRRYLVVHISRKAVRRATLTDNGRASASKI